VRVPIDPDRDLAALPFSSGTSGLPKGVELTHTALVTNVRQGEASLGFHEQDVVVAVAPFFHALGLNLVLPGSLAAGATVVTLGRFDLEAFLSLIQQHRATLTIVVPPIALALAYHPMVDNYACPRCGRSVSVRHRWAPTRNSGVPSGWAVRSRRASA
jgi:acyl-CoA synthetase (AMP-forming)/AMP-acid ligase II